MLTLFPYVTSCGFISYIHISSTNTVSSVQFLLHPYSKLKDELLPFNKGEVIY